MISVAHIPVISIDGHMLLQGAAGRGCEEGPTSKSDGEEGPTLRGQRRPRRGMSDGRGAGVGEGVARRGDDMEGAGRGASVAERRRCQGRWRRGRNIGWEGIRS